MNPNYFATNYESHPTSFFDTKDRNQIIDLQLDDSDVIIEEEGVLSSEEKINEVANEISRQLVTIVKDQLRSK